MRSGKFIPAKVDIQKILFVVLLIFSIIMVFLFTNQKNDIETIKIKSFEQSVLIRNLKSQVSDLEDEKSNLDDQIRNLDGSIDDLEGRIDDLENRRVVITYQ